MTEEEAKTKWCPMVRAGNEAGCNRQDASDKCIASGCMMWRDYADRIRNPIIPDEMKGHGYCGLAGKP